jgi:hypothetical protein
MKERGRVTPLADEQAITFLEETLITEGYAIPCEPAHVSDADLGEYGKGQPLELDILRRSFESLTQRSTGAMPVNESLARAARNGTKISDDIWQRMKSDRDRAEGEAGIP